MKKIAITFCLLFLLVLVGCKQPHQKKKNTVTTNTNQTAVLISNPQNKASCVFLARDLQGNVYMSWVAIDSLQKKHFYYSKLQEKTHVFGQKKEIPIAQNAAIHEEGMPKIAFKGDGSLFALYEVSIPMKGKKWGLGDIRYTQSSNNGKTWSVPKSIDPQALAHKWSGNFSNIRRLKNGEIGISWLASNANSEKEGRLIKFAHTTSTGGVSSPKIVDTHTCQCCRTAIAGGLHGNVYLAYRDIQPGNYRDISIAISRNNGKTFEKPLDFSQDHWKINGCPHNGPAITTTNQKIYVTWFTNGKNNTGVNLAVLDTLGTIQTIYNLSRNGQFIQVDKGLNGNPLIAYNESYSYQEGSDVFSRIVVCQLKNNILYKKEVTPIHIQASYPMIMATTNHKAVVAWKNNQKIYYRLVDFQSINTPVLNMRGVVMTH